MSITPLPSLDHTSPTFKAEVNTFFADQLPTFSVEVEAARAAIVAAQSATSADAIQTGQDKVTTAADRVQTGQDRVQTGQDRVQTGLDRAAAEAAAAVAGGAAAFIDSNPIVKGSADATKQIRLEVDGITTGTTRALAVPNFDGALAVSARAADIASAATVNLDTATGDLIHITGTTTISAITLANGLERDVVFDGALTLTHNATTLILPGGANITTAAGDRATFRGDGSGNVRCMHYTKANGQAVIGAAALTSYYASAEQSITVAGLLTLAHGLGQIPKAVELFIICKTAEMGYAVNDITIPIPNTSSNSTTAVYMDATNIYIRYGSAGSSSVGYVVHKTTGTPSGITNGSWRLIVRAFA